MSKDPVLLHMQRTAASYRSAGLVEKAEKLEAMLSASEVYRPGDDGHLRRDEVDVVLSEDADDSEPAYDPGEHTVADVKLHLAEHPEQREAVLDAERAGKARASILNY